jgi:hypothetical protein
VVVPNTKIRFIQWKDGAAIANTASKMKCIATRVLYQTSTKTVGFVCHVFTRPVSTTVGHTCGSYACVTRWPDIFDVFSGFSIIQPSVFTPSSAGPIHKAQPSARLVASDRLGSRKIS